MKIDTSLINNPYFTVDKSKAIAPDVVKANKEKFPESWEKIENVVEEITNYLWDFNDPNIIKDKFPSWFPDHRPTPELGSPHVVDSFDTRVFDDMLDAFRATLKEFAIDEKDVYSKKINLDNNQDIQERFYQRLKRTTYGKQYLEQQENNNNYKTEMNDFFIKSLLETTNK